ncbi:MAG: hypothetical protein WBL40_12730, partial [Terrimicrobiaceae bacterium]
MSNDDGKLAAGRAASASRLGRLLRNIAAAAIENVIDLLAQRLELEDESRIVFFCLHRLSSWVGCDELDRFR